MQALGTSRNHVQTHAMHAHAEALAQLSADWPGLSKVEVAQLAAPLNVARAYQLKLFVNTGTEMPAAIERP